MKTIIHDGTKKLYIGGKPTGTTLTSCGRVVLVAKCNWSHNKQKVTCKACKKAHNIYKHA